MITVTGRKLNIPRSDLEVGCAGDDLVEIRNFELSRFYGDVDLSLFDFKLDTTRTVSIIILTIVTSLYGVLSYWLGSKVLGIKEIDFYEDKVIYFWKKIFKKF